MTDELLGELAARMKLIADALPQHKLSALQALGLARECVRQMESAWLQGERAGEDTAMGCGYTLDDALTNNYPELGPKRGDYPLELAPEDWTP